ncbi:MAG: PAS domain-containing protein [Anaerolineae bacterium]|nr:PAS domain-containing protein [Anaerolineae bacterium]
MEWQYTLYVILAPLTVAMALGALFFARRYRHTSPRATVALQWLIACVIGWVTLNTFELVAPTEAGTLFWARTSYLFIATSPVAWLAFALHHTGRQGWLTPARLASLGIVPAAIIILALTNGSHGLLWREYEFVPAAGFLSLRILTYGPAFWVCAAYGYLLVAAGSLLIIRHSFTAFRLYRRQSRLMVVGSLMPVVLNLVYVFHLIPGLQKDYTPASFALASIVFVVAMARYRLFEVKPIARNLVIDTLHAPVLALDTGGRIVDLNRAAVALIAPHASDQVAQRLIGCQVEDALAAWPALRRVLPARCEQHIPLTLEVEGSCRHYDCRTLPLADPRGRPAGEVVVLHDVTAHILAEGTLRHYAEALEAQNQELNAFASTVAHDLKNPLAVIQAYAEVLAEDLAEMSEHDVQTFLRSISDSTKWMAHIVDELLLLARVRQTSDVPLSSLDMEEIVEQSVGRLEELIRRARAQLTIAAGWPAAVGHAPWVTEVWTNYLSNALKYGGRPDLDLPPQVEIGFDADPSTAFIRFWVRDKGPGLSPQEQERLFVEFSRLPANERTISGYGLGLSIVQRIIHKLGGEVGVDSHPGEGSTFWFTLPRAVVRAPDPVSTGTPPPPPERVPDTPHAARGHTPG